MNIVLKICIEKFQLFPVLKDIGKKYIPSELPEENEEGKNIQFFSMIWFRRQRRNLWSSCNPTENRNLSLHNCKSE
jgi:hypothetical protein